MSSGRAWMRAAWMQNCRQSPGLGSAMWRTWYSTSKFSSSTQYGLSRFSGTRSSLRRNMAEPASRLSMCARMLLKRTLPPGAVDWS